LGLVVAGGVEDQVAEEFAGGGGDHADVQIVDEHDDVGSGVGSSDAEVVERAGGARGDDSSTATLSSPPRTPIIRFGGSGPAISPSS
jgi:hypothetical protein